MITTETIKSLFIAGVILSVPGLFFIPEGRIFFRHLLVDVRRLLKFNVLYISYRGFYSQSDMENYIEIASEIIKEKVKLSSTKTVIRKNKQLHVENSWCY